MAALLGPHLGTRAGLGGDRTRNKGEYRGEALGRRLEQVYVMSEGRTLESAPTLLLRRIQALPEERVDTIR